MIRLILLSFALMLASCGSTYTPTNYNQTSTIARKNNLDDICAILAGSIVIANDGKFLGRITGKFDSESIFNQFGNFGSEFSSSSIWNNFSSYGGEFSQYSPFNQYSSTPPALVKNGELLGYLSVNKSLMHAVNPLIIKSCAL